MKKLISAVMVIAMAMSLSACSEEQPSVTKSTESGSITQPTTEETTSPTVQEETSTTSPTIQEETSATEDPLDWGYREVKFVESEESSGFFSVNFPHGTGLSVVYGAMGEWPDAGFLISGQSKDSPEVADVSELLPAYLEQIQESFEDYYGIRSSNYTIMSDEDVSLTSINDYEMYIFTGRVSFDYYWDGETLKKDFPFIVYATALKSNGLYAYWMVYDCSEDHSKGDLIAEYALKMAKTFQENPRLI